MSHLSSYYIITRDGVNMPEQHGGNDDLTGTGYVAPIGSIYQKTDGTFWYKSGATNTDWTLLVPVPEGTVEDQLLFWNNTSGAWEAVSPGTEDQILRVQSGGTVAWVDLPDYPTAMNQGDILFWNATLGTWTILPIGTAGQVLEVNSGATAPEWVTETTPIIQAGQIALGSGDDTFSVTFPTAMPDTNYSVQVTEVNTVDASVVTTTAIITEKLTTGFTAELAGQVPSANYAYGWLVVSY